MSRRHDAGKVAGLSMRIENLIFDGLCTPVPALTYHVSRTLTRLCPEKAILGTRDPSFRLHAFAQAGECLLTPSPEIFNHFSTYWLEPPVGQIMQTAENAWFQVSWQGHRLDVLEMSWPTGSCDQSYNWILADSRETAEHFFATICGWNQEVCREVLVFDGGDWSRSEALLQSISSATFDNLILPASLKQQLQSDFVRFLASREVYTRYGVPWKRGILLIGPPGNGKTHAVKALLNTVDYPCLYVKSFKARWDTEHDCIREVFRFARRRTPCLLVLEDLDSLIDDGNRSFFLNELDGFATNSGVMTIATTNHPERLDPAILERPSRFDRKYHFDLPTTAERRAYLDFWSRSLEEPMRLPDACVETIASSTDGFSFAYLKELMLASIMAWIDRGETGGMDSILPAQVALLRGQMSSRPAATLDEIEMDEG